MVTRKIGVALPRLSVLPNMAEKFLNNLSRS